MPDTVIYTMGHSTLTLDDFVAAVRSFDVSMIVDIRTVPRSRTNPQYNADTLPGLLAPYEIEYERIADLGGLRKKSSTVATTANGFWENQSFHNYADYALSQPFEAGLMRLIELSESHRCAIMCAESVWWRCHRRIVADYLLVRGFDVVHIMGEGKSNKAVLNPAARMEGLKLLYPPADDSIRNVSALAQDALKADSIG